MEDVLLIDAAERYVKGEMTTEERIYFEEIRKNNPELDQLVVEHMFFLAELDKYSAQKVFRHNLYEVESKLTEEGLINKSPLNGKSKLVYLWNKSKRTMAVAASIAGIISLLSVAMISILTKKQNESEIKPLVDKLKEIEKNQKKVDQKINQLNTNVAASTAVKPRVESRFRATGFMIDATNNFIVTNAHVLKEATHQLIVENNKGEQFFAEAAYVNHAHDIAILRVTDTGFRKMAPIPYSIRKTNAELGEHIFMLGYPKNEIVYGEGYVSAKNGFKLDTIFCQLNTSANEGNSGSPVINRKGELIGVISSMETNADGVVFAIKASNIHRAVEEAKKIKENEKIKIVSNPSLRGVEREVQIKKVEDYVFMIKGN